MSLHYLVTLGTPTLVVSGKPFPLSLREAVFLTYISMQLKSSIRRDRLYSIFWPDVDEAKSKHSLSQILYSIRTRFPLLLNNSEEGIIRCQNTETDVQALLNMDVTGDAFGIAGSYTRGFLTGELWSKQLEDWRSRISMLLTDRFEQAFQEAVIGASAAELPNIVQACENFVSDHPYSVKGQLALITASCRLNDIANAKRLHEELVAEWKDDLTIPDFDSFVEGVSDDISQNFSDSLTLRFVGRVEELSTIRQAWNRAARGEGNTVTINGEPGIGKTRLADQALRRIAIQGGKVWSVACRSFSQRLPYSVIAELCKTNDVPAGIHELPSMSPSSTDDLDATSPDERRHRLVESITDSIIAASDKQPLAIFVDDAQWADDFTALLLAYWAYRLRRSRVLLLIAYRTHDSEQPSDWITNTLVPSIQVSLGQMGIEAASDMVASYEQSHRTSISPRARDKILWQSAGRPFLILEGLAQLSRNEDILDSAVVLPESAEALLRRRFRNLSEDTTWLVSLLAVLGRPIDPAALHEISGMSDNRLMLALDTLHARGITHSKGHAVLFSHDLMRETAYRLILPANRVLLHSRVAASLVKAGEDPGILAQHYAAAGQTEKAGESALAAATRALSKYLYSDFEFFCEIAIESGLEEQRMQAAGYLAKYLIRFGRNAETAKLLPLVSKYRDVSPEAGLLLAIAELERDFASGSSTATELIAKSRAILAMARQVYEAGLGFVALTLFDLALDTTQIGYGEEVAKSLIAAASGSDRGELRWQLDAVIALWNGVSSGAEDALEGFLEKLQDFDHTQSTFTRALCYSSKGTLLLLNGRLTEALEAFDVAQILAESGGDVRRQAAIGINRGVVLMEMGRTPLAEKSLASALTARNTHFVLRARVNLTIMHYEAGDYSYSLQEADAVLATNSTYGSPNIANLAFAIKGLIALDNGRLDEAKECAERIHAASEEPGFALDDTSYTVAFLARLMNQSGEGHRAVEQVKSAIDRTSSLDKLCWLRLRCEHATLIAQFDVDAAYRAAREIRDIAITFGAERIRQRAERIIESARA